MIRCIVCRVKIDKVQTDLYFSSLLHAYSIKLLKNKNKKKHQCSSRCNEHEHCDD